MTPYEERVHRAYLIGWHHHASEREYIGLDELLIAVQSDKGFDAVIESREQWLARLLEREREALRKLRAEKLEWQAVPA